MRNSLYFGLLGTIYLAPHLPLVAGAVAAAVSFIFGIFAMVDECR
jgi:hypothetical protein